MFLNITFRPVYGHLSDFEIKKRRMRQLNKVRYKICSGACIHLSSKKIEFCIIAIDKPAKCRPVYLILSVICLLHVMACCIIYNAIQDLSSATTGVESWLL